MRADGAQDAVTLPVDRINQMDVLVNNAAKFYADSFEDLTPGQIEHQLATALISPMNVALRTPREVTL